MKSKLNVQWVEHIYLALPLSIFHSAVPKGFLSRGLYIHLEACFICIFCLSIDKDVPKLLVRYLICLSIYPFLMNIMYVQ